MYVQVYFGTQEALDLSEEDLFLSKKNAHAMHVVNF